MGRGQALSLGTCSALGVTEGYLPTRRSGGLRSLYRCFNIDERGTRETLSSTVRAGRVFRGLLTLVGRGNRPIRSGPLMCGTGGRAPTATRRIERLGRLVTRCKVTSVVS